MNFAKFQSGRLRKSAFVGALCASLSFPAVASAVELTYASFANPNHPILTDAIEPFFARVSEATGGEVTGRVFPASQLLGAREILGGISDGVVRSGYIMPQFYPSDLPHQLTVANMIAYGEDPLAVAAAVNELVLLDCETCQQDYANFNAITLATFAATGNILMCNQPLPTLESLSGIRVRSTGIYSDRLRDAGAVPLNMVASESAEALERAQVDCVLGPTEWLQSYGLQDSVTHITDVSLGINRGLSVLVASKSTWEELPEEQRQAVLDELPGLAADATLAFVEGDLEARKLAEEQGIEILPGDDALHAAMQPKDSDVEALREHAQKLGVENTDELLEKFLAKLEKWEGIMSEIGKDRDAYAEALDREIYSKL